MNAPGGRRSVLAFSWRMLWRDWRGGELRILAVAVAFIGVISALDLLRFLER